MAAINSKRVWIGALAGGVLWSVWSFAIGALVIGEEQYQKAQQAGVFLSQPRYPYFLPVWLLSLFALSFGGAWLYARVRGVAGPGPKTAACVGAWLGFAAGFPGNFAQATWLNADRVLPLGWTLDLWGGAILATLVAGWLYREA
ncbi:MAG TPA: hypothetical protein VLI67_02990 [Vicinamibacteria bacterium]|nr:hypothetical protein [Vicinamibacteria bacterium]